MKAILLQNESLKNKICCTAPPGESQTAEQTCNQAQTLIPDPICLTNLENNTNYIGSIKKNPHFSKYCNKVY